MPSGLEIWYSQAAQLFSLRAGDHNDQRESESMILAQTQSFSPPLRQFSGELPNTSLGVSCAGIKAAATPLWQREGLARRRDRKNGAPWSVSGARTNTREPSAIHKAPLQGALADKLDIFPAKNRQRHELMTYAHLSPKNKERSNWSARERPQQFILCILINLYKCISNRTCRNMDDSQQLLFIEDG